MTLDDLIDTLVELRKTAASEAASVFVKDGVIIKIVDAEVDEEGDVIIIV